MFWGRAGIATGIDVQLATVRSANADVGWRVSGIVPSDSFRQHSYQKRNGRNRKRDLCMHSRVVGVPVWDLHATGGKMFEWNTVYVGAKPRCMGRKFRNG